MTDFTRDWIAEREQLEQAATEGPWVREWDTSDQWWTIHGQPSPAKGDDRMVCPEVATLNHREDWTADVDLIVDARTALPAALAALEAVLALHRRAGGVAIPVFCLHCQEFNDGTWPCPTINAVESALRGES